MTQLNNPNQSIKRGFTVERETAAQPENARFIPVENEPPLYTDENGLPSYDNNQSWFGTMNDRRLFWATGGGAGYWGGVPQIETPVGTIGWGALRTPVRAFYDWSIGLDPDAREDPEWTKMKQDSSWIDNQVKLIEDNLGLTADFIKEDFGELALRNVVLNSVSLDDQTARLTFVIDSAEAKRRIMDYDNDSNIGTFMGTKVSSAIFNVMAPDPLTTIPTIASMGGTQILGVSGRLLSLNGRLPWVMNAEKAAQTYIQTHQVGLNLGMAAWAPIDGAMSAYAYHHGWNKDQSIIYKDPTQSPNYDESATDDVLLGLGIGTLAGGLTYSMIGRNVGRAAANEAMALARESIPSDWGMDWNVRYANAQARAQRTVLRNGMRNKDPIYGILGNREEMWNRGFRSPEAVEELADTIDEVKPNAQELESILAQRQIAEHNRAVAFRERTNNYLKNNTDVDDAGNPIPNEVLDADGNKVVNIAGRREAFADSLEADAHAALKAKGLDDAGIDELEAWIRTRVGVDRVDLYRWALVSDPSASDIGVLRQFIRSNIAEEIKIHNRMRQRLGDSPLSDKSSRTDLTAVENAIESELESLLNKYNGTPVINTIADAYNRFVAPTLRALKEGLGWDTGHPGAFVKSITDAIDYKVRDKILRKIDKDLKAGILTADQAEDLKKIVEYSDWRNRMLRQRLTEGELGERLGIFNSNLLPLTDNPKLTNGLYPTRTRFSGEKDLDVLDDPTWHGAAHKELPNNPRKVANAPSETQYQKIQKRLRAAESANVKAASRATVITAVSELLYRAMTLAQARNLIAKAQTNVSLKIFGKDVKFKPLKSVIEISFRDETGQFGKGIRLDYTDDLGEIFTDASVANATATNQWDQLVIDQKKLMAALEARAEALKKAQAELATAETEFAKAGKERRLGYGMRDDDFVFANANSISRLMRRADFAGLWRLTRWSMNNNINGMRAGRLWFNPEAANRGGAFSMILQLANMIDTPHVLRGDFGTHPLRMNSIQQLRNYNAVQAHRVIRVIKDFARVGNPFTADDHDLIRRAVMQEMNQAEEMVDIGPPIQLNNKQRQLYDAFVEFADTFQRDLNQIYTSMGRQPLTRADLFNVIFGQVNQSVMLSRRGEFRQGAARVMANLHEEQMGHLERQARLLASGGLIQEGETTLWNLNRLQRTDPAGNISIELNQAIADATDAESLRSLFNLNLDGTLPENLARRGFGVDVLLRDITDLEAANVRNIDDLLDLMRTKRNNRPFLDYMQGRLNAFSDDIDPLTNRYTRQTNGAPPADPLRFTGLQTLDDPVLHTVRYDDSLSEFFHRNLADMAVEFAHGQGTRIRAQAEFSRLFGDQHPNQSVFRMLADAREEILNEANRTNDNALRAAVENDLNNLEDMMAHAFGFRLEANPRYGWAEAGMRLYTNLIRIPAGGFWGMNALFHEIPKAFLLGVNRNGFINSFIDLLKALPSKSQLEDIGAVIDQYTRRFSLGIDNEADVGGIALSKRLAIPGTQMPGILFHGNVSPLRNIRTAGSMLMGRTVDPSGAARGVMESGGGGIQRGLARVLDAVNHLAEGSANATTRFSGLQYFSAVGKDMAVRAGKRKLVREIESIRNFSRDLHRTWENSRGQRINIDTLESYDARLAAFKELAAKHGLDWAFLARLNHHGLLNEGDLGLLARAFREESVTGRRGFWASVQGDNIYNTQGLREYLDRMDIASNAGIDAVERAFREIAGMQATITPTNRTTVDQIMMKLTGYLEEEAHTAVAGATAMSATPNAEWYQRLIGAFSSFTRGAQQQNILRGANDSNLARIMAMAIPLMVLEAIYQEGRRVIISKSQGQDSYEKTLADIERNWREQPEVMLWKTWSKIPIFGSINGFLFNNVLDPFDNTILPSTADKQLTSPDYTLQNAAHRGIYAATEAIVDGENVMDKIIGPDVKAKDIIREPLLPTTSRRGVFMPAYSGFEFQPFKDLFRLMTEIGETNPYVNKQEKYFGIPTGLPWAEGGDRTYGQLYKFFPGFNAWQIQAAMRTAGYYMYEDESRAVTYRRMQERIKQNQ